MAIRTRSLVLFFVALAGGLAVAGASGVRRGSGKPAARGLAPRGRRGQALVELALVLPVLMLLVVGLIEMARAWNQHQVITDAAREMCRRAVIYNPAVTQAKADSVGRHRIESAAFDPDLAIITFPDGFKAGWGKETTCRIEMPYVFGLLAPVIKTITGTDRINMITIARFRNE